MRKSQLKEYARLIAKVGGKIEKGQRVIILAQLDQPEFVTMVVEECYRLGAEKVEVEWEHQPIKKLQINHTPIQVLSKVEKWEREKLQYRTDKLPVMIYLLSEDPDGLDGVDMEKYVSVQQERFKVIKPFRDKMENRYQWCIAAVPGKEWAKKVFPQLRTSAAINKLWDAILYTSRVTKDSVKEWKLHNEELEKRCEYLNSKNLKELIFSSSNGTNLRVGLIENSVFLGGGEYTLDGHFFNPNIPSEEIFITPKKGEAEGIVYSSRPFSCRGQLIENFSIRFEKGRAVEIHAEKNEENLLHLINTDEGSAYLGECALVPYDSPIRNSEILFYNTLFDENAACHLALGRGFINSIIDYEKYSLDECRKMGINDSQVHEDFMIGTKDMSIIGIDKNGNEISIFKNGNWDFSV